MSKAWLIALVAVLSGIIFFVVNSLFVTPLYTSQATLYVSNMAERKSSIVTTGDVGVSKQLVTTCIVIMNSRTVLDKVAEEAGLEYSASQIKGMFSAEAVQSSEIFKITVTNPDPVKAQIIADAIIKVAPAEIKRVMNAGNVSIIDYATLPLSPSSPNIPKNTLVGAVLGAILCVFAILFFEVLNTRIKSEFELVDNFKLPIIGIVPSFARADRTNTNKRRRR